MNLVFNANVYRNDRGFVARAIELSVVGAPAMLNEAGYQGGLTRDSVVEVLTYDSKRISLPLPRTR